MKKLVEYKERRPKPYKRDNTIMYEIYEEPVYITCSVCGKHITAKDKTILDHYRLNHLEVLERKNAHTN